MSFHIIWKKKKKLIFESCNISSIFKQTILKFYLILMCVADRFQLSPWLLDNYSLALHKPYFTTTNNSLFSGCLILTSFVVCIKSLLYLFQERCNDISIITVEVLPLLYWCLRGYVHACIYREGNAISCRNH